MVATLVLVKACTFCDFDVHEDGSFNASAFCVKFQTLLGLFLENAPIPLAEPVVINCIDDGELSLCEGNEASTCFHVQSLEGRFCLADEPAFLLRIPLKAVCHRKPK